MSKNGYRPLDSITHGVEAPAIIGAIAVLLPLLTHDRISTAAAGAIGVLVVGVFQGFAHWLARTGRDMKIPWRKIRKKRSK